MRVPLELDHEQTVLATALYYPATAIPLLRDGGLRPAHFSRRSHGIIWRTILEMAQEGRNVNCLSVARALPEPLGDRDGHLYLCALVASALFFDEGNLRFHARQITESHAARDWWPSMTEAEKRENNRLHNIYVNRLIERLRPIWAAEGIV